MEQTRNPSRLHSIRSAAQYCQTVHSVERSENSLRKHINKGKILATRARDGSIRIEEAELDRFERGEPMTQNSA